MSSIKYDMALRLHVSDDDYRPAMQHVSDGGNGYLFASDSLTLMRVKKEACAKNYEQVENYPNAQKIVDQIDELIDKELTIKVDDALSKLAAFELNWVFKQTNCTECKGSGDCECIVCGALHDCEACDGSGEVESKEPFIWMDIADDGDKVQIGNKNFKPRLIYRMLQTALILRADELKVQYSEDKLNGVKFILDDFAQVVVMPLAY